MGWLSQKSADLYQTHRTDARCDRDYGRATEAQMANRICQPRYKRLVDKFQGVYKRRLGWFYGPSQVRISRNNYRRAGFYGPAQTALLRNPRDRPS